MATCELCGKEFKNRAGLAGHKQLKHRLEPSPKQLDEPQESSLMERLRSAMEQPEKPSESALAERLERVVERLESMVNQPAKADHTHFGTPKCSDCQHRILQIKEQSKQEGISSIMALGGVPHAREYHAWAIDLQRQNPGIFVVLSPEEVPGVKERIAKYQEEREKLSKATEEEKAHRMFLEMLEQVTNPEKT